jgi:hypothetical protein
VPNLVSDIVTQNYREANQNEREIRGLAENGKKASFQSFYPGDSCKSQNVIAKRSKSLYNNPKTRASPTGRSSVREYANIW